MNAISTFGKCGNMTEIIEMMNKMIAVYVKFNDDQDLTLNPTTEPSQAPHEPYPCDEADKASKRETRPFNKTKVGNCLHPGYHTRYYDDMVNTFTAAINILYEMNVTFVVVQGTLLSLLRNQPILPWDTDADIYLVLDESLLNDIMNNNTNT